MILAERNNNSVLNGLVLAGGKSSRMGQDKSMITWHGKAQCYTMADMLSQLCNNVYISCRPGQKDQLDNSYNTLEDAYTDLGPYGAILSAFKFQPDVAWLITACDLPLLDIATLQYLIEHRDTSKIATTFQSPHDGLPEPLITIWEPQSYPVLLSFLSEGRTCPRKALINSDIHLLTPPDPTALMNVNTPQEMETAQQLISNKTIAR
ncbi:MAG: NTP transferase domain-containing protein [Flavipsychrobacter sp.]